MRKIPRDSSPDSTLAFLRQPYDFISQRCEEHDADLFQTRLFLHRTICMLGKEAAELIYDTDRFERRGVPPGRIQKTLFGRGGVQGLDDEDHRHRKQMFLSVIDDGRVGELSEQTAHWLQIYAKRWTGADQVILYRELQRILCRAICDWSGIPLPEADVPQRAEQLTKLFDYAGSAGPKHWQARLARRRANAWCRQIIEQIRREELKPPESSAAHVIAWYRDRQNELLSPHAAAVELLNVLRPTVAVSVYITFAAAALHQYPRCRERLQQDGESYAEAFAQEVRRFYPFFPFIGARVRQAFDWHHYHFPKGRLVMLDLYGTNHDGRIWEAPDEFRPERFEHHQPDAFEFVPQGGGDRSRNHRCPGEPIATELIRVAVKFLVQQITYEVPEQDLEIDRSRLPALPRSHMIIQNVQPLGGAAVG